MTNKTGLSPDEILQIAFEEGQPADNGDGYLFTAEEFDLFVQRLLDSTALAEPAPPADREPEVFAWARDVPKPGHLGGIITTEFKNSCVRADGSPGGFEHTVPLIRLSDHRAHVTRLRAEVEELGSMLGAEQAKSKSMERLAESRKEERDTLQSELTKARELLREWLVSNFTGSCPERNDLRCRTDYALSNQSAPADKGQGAPVTYSSTQATNCAGCGKYKHTPLRVDGMGGYVCLTCIDERLEKLLDAEQLAPVSVVMPDRIPAPVVGMVINGVDHYFKDNSLVTDNGSLVVSAEKLYRQP